MVIELYALHFEFYLVALLDNLPAAFVVGRLVLGNVLLLLIKLTLLFLHLPIEWEELSCFFRCQFSIPHNELLQFSIELFWREFFLLRVS